MADFISFPDHFRWGVATSAYQIEGAWDTDGKGPSIWDTFVHVPGKIYKEQNADVSVDHYHRYVEDVKIMKTLGLDSYRFSFSWSRILPDGKGAANSAGLSFYDRLIDCLLENGIEPCPTLFHYDLPQKLQDHGGWPNRDTAYHFADYASLVSSRFSDRVKTWITHNEPFVTAANGHLIGDHAPGIKDIGCAVAAIHHILLSHGLAVQALRQAAQPPVKIGITLNMSVIHPASDSILDRRAASRADTILNRTPLDAIFLGAYSPEVLSLIGLLLPEVRSEDASIISSPIDFLGLNYYSRSTVKYEENMPFVELIDTQPEGDYTQMWEIYPAGIYELLTRMWKEYQIPNIMITENGIPLSDDIDLDNKIRDNRRIQYLQDHLIQVQRAIAEGVPVTGYFVWTLMDNFEWALGYRPRFGLVHVDFDSLQRTIKNSGYWFSEVIRNNGFTPQVFFKE